MTNDAGPLEHSSDRKLDVFRGPVTGKGGGGGGKGGGGVEAKQQSHQQWAESRLLQEAAFNTLAARSKLFSQYLRGPVEEQTVQSVPRKVLLRHCDLPVPS